MTTTTTVSTGASYTVPAGITKVRATARGAAGGSGLRALAGGRGVYMQSMITVSPADVLAASAILGGTGGAGSSPGIAGGNGGSGVNIGGLVFAGGGGGAGGTEASNQSQGTGGDAGLNGSDGAVGFNTGAYGGFLEPGHGAAGAAGGAAGTGATATGAPPYSSISGGGTGAAGKDHSAGGAGGAGGASGGGGAGGGGAGGGGYAGGGGGRGPQSGRGGVGGGGAGGSSLGDSIVGYNTSTTADALFEVAAAPLIPTLISPTGNMYVDRTKPIVLSIIHNAASTDVLDAESHWSIQYRAVGAGSWILTEADGVANVATIAANTLAVGQYEWQAWTNADGIAGAKSAITTFRASNPPADPAMVTPADAATITDINFTTTWTSVGQLEWQSRLIGDASGTPNPGVVYDSAGAVSGALTTTMRASVNSVAAHDQVRIRNVSGGLWSNWVSHAVTIAWAGPVAPEPFTSSDSAQGLTNIGWTQPATTVDVDHYRITAVENGVTRTVISTVETADRSAIDHIPLSGVPTAYHVIAYAASGAFTEGTTGWSD